MGKVALVVGALGVVGRAVLAHLESLDDWTVIALSRRPPDFPTRANFISVDLTEAAGCRSRLAGLSGTVTHVFYTAYAPQPSLAEEAVVNARMLINLVEALDDTRASSLAHIQLMQGSKWYGNHLGPYKTPAVEDDPRHAAPSFYYAQQDWLADRQRGRTWTWSALRPHGVLGLAIGSSMNQLTALALYASIRRELGQPLAWPGAPGAFASVYQFTEAAYLARGMEWAATSPRCANQAFNFTNGDFVRWCHLWPKIAAFFHMEAAPVSTISLVEEMADKEPLWAALIERHGLQSHRLADLTNWRFADFVFGCDYDQMSDMTRARNAGWQGANPSPHMYLRLLGELRRQRIIP